MSAVIFTVAIGKGGSGKTTTVANLGTAFAEQGNRVCLIDLDPQGGLTKSLGCNQRAFQKEETLYYALLQKVRLSSIIIQPKQASVHLVPANLDLYGCELELRNDNGQSLKHSLSHITSFYDILLIDCPPNLGMLTMNALVAADVVLIPVQCEYLAFDAIKDLVFILKELRGENAPYVLFPTMVRNTKMSQDVIGKLATDYNGHCLETKIKNTIKFADASLAGMSVLHFANGSLAASQYRQLAYELMQLLT